MSGVDVDRELARLRVRAYGPHADIADDPAALARLIELEKAVAAGPSSLSAPEPASPPEPSVAEGEQWGAETASTPAIETAHERRHRVARTVGIVLSTVGATMVGAAAVGAGLGLGLDNAGEGAHDAVLRAAEQPVARQQAERSGLEDIATYTDYRGMQVASGTLEGILCVLVLRAVETGVGPPVLACGAPGLAAIADLTILSQSAGGARSTAGTLAAGTVVRFTLGRDVVHVDLSDAPVET